MPTPRKISWNKADGSLSTAWEIRYKDQRGKRRSKQFTTKKEAKEFSDTIVSSVRAGTHVHDRDTVTLSEACKNWIAASKRGRDGREPVERSTLVSYQNHVDKYIEPALGAYKLTVISTAVIRDFRDIDLLDQGVSRAMTKKILSSLYSIFSEAVADELLSTNPCVGVQIVTSGRHKEKIEIPSKEAVRTVVQTAAAWVDLQPRAIGSAGRLTEVPRISKHRALWFYTMVRFIVSTGVRLSEARGAAKSSLDLRNGLYHVTQRADEYGIIGKVKSRAGERSLDLSTQMVADLNRWLEVAPAGDLLFANGDGNPERASNIYKRFWFPLMIETGFAVKTMDDNGSSHKTDFTIHGLRHFHASLMIDAGMQIKELQEHMGHATIQMTLDTYGHLFKDDMAMARRRAMIVGAEDRLFVEAGKTPEISHEPPVTN